MANRQWLEEVKRRLVENQLPPRYIRRFMDELADHLEDLMEEKKMSQEKNCLSQLGEPSQVAESAVVAYRQRTFFGRHPMAKFLVFGVSPLLSMVLGFCLMCFCVFLFCVACDKYGIPLSIENYLRSIKNPWAFDWGMSIITIIFPSVLLTFCYCRWIEKSNLSRRWMLLSCFMVAIIPFLMTQKFTISEIAGKSSYTIGLGLPPTVLQQYVQMLTPLVVGLWFMRQSRTNKPTDSEESFRAAA